MRINAAARTAAADGVVDQMETGAGTAVLQLRTGAAPTNITDAAAGTLLASFNLPNPAFGGASSGVATLLGVPIAATGAAAGNVGHARFVNRNGDAVMDTNNVGVAGTEEVVLDTLTVSIGLPLSLTAATITMPAGTP